MYTNAAMLQRRRTCWPPNTRESGAGSPNNLHPQGLWATNGPRASQSRALQGKTLTGEWEANVKLEDLPPIDGSPQLTWPESVL